MNNNDNKIVVNNNGNLVPNNQMQNINIPNNNYQNNFNKNYNGDNDQLKKQAKKCKSISIAYLCMYLLELICVIITGYFLTRIIYNNLINDITAASNNTDPTNISNLILNNDDFHSYLFMLIPMVIIGIVIFVLGIVLTVKTHSLARNYRNSDSL